MVGGSRGRGWPDLNRKGAFMRLLVSVALAALVAGCTSSQVDDGPSAASFPALAGADRCAAVPTDILGSTATGRWIEEANRLPGFCEVTATLSPVSGSNIG